ncbi:phytoene synthase [Bryocella elongata]|uniref:Phytoene synthase n=1 Tax=Bryocella elongata TaxID=863522 RepID=A0A1H5TNH9_9BACT|nr:phytoene/squalene synthase family protein [Bryocella elongata]SEF64330.1 phytoene synthase [Bryocella elongata]
MTALQPSPRTPELQRAYDECRAIAKREARNFYYAFLVLPKHKSDAMCAIYAFMRKADDLSDDESMSIADRRFAMAAWTDALRRARTEPTGDPIFLAVNDTQQRFGIPDSLLDQLVEGTTMDLRERMQGVVDMHVAGKDLQVYESFDGLYHYCYLVASVVGLVCIRIFGYTDPRAEQLAEKTGVAFQLTNILRDVKEDAERGRVYLPLDDMQDTGSSVDDILLATTSAAPSSQTMELIEREIARAQEYYRASDELIPLLDADAREAMRVLAAIYHRLLDRIEADPTAVFRERVSVPTAQKLAMLGRGLLSAFFVRGRA